LYPGVQILRSSGEPVYGAATPLAGACLHPVPIARNQSRSTVSRDRRSDEHASLLRKIERAQVEGRWVHSHEEDTDDETVFRAADSGYAFPPSRGREALELRVIASTWTERLPASARMTAAFTETSDVTASLV
jgi:hypothetical protein